MKSYSFDSLSFHIKDKPEKKISTPNRGLGKLGHHYINGTFQKTFNKKISTMKTILPVLCLFLVACLVVPSQAQDFRKLEDFNEIAIAGKVEVTLMPADENSATIYTEGISSDDVTMYVKGNTLKVQLYESWLKDDEEARIEIKYKAINELRVSAGAIATHEGTLKSDDLTLKVSSGAQLEITVDAELLTAAVIEGAELTISGQAGAQEVTAGTGGQYYGMSLECNTTEVNANTGGEADVTAYEKLDANANTGGIINYKGSPEMKSTRSFIAGDINKIQQ